MLTGHADFTDIMRQYIFLRIYPNKLTQNIAEGHFLFKAKPKGQEV